MIAKKNIKLFVPDVGEAKSIELISWNVKVTELVEQGQELCELVTDKAAFPLEAPESGKVISILKKEGEIVKIGDALIEFQVASTQEV